MTRRKFFIALLAIAGGYIIVSAAIMAAMAEVVK